MKEIFMGILGILLYLYIPAIFGVPATATYLEQKKLMNSDDSNSNSIINKKHT